LSTIKQQGYCVDVDCLGADVASLAVPLLDRTKSAIGSLCIVGPAFRFSEEKTRNELLPPLVEAGRTISTRLGYLDYYMA
jgi:DNA-binding IclR family transcriptional regulator